MPIAANITMVTVTGEYVDYQGQPIAGQVVFTLPKLLRNQLADQIVVPSSYTVTLNAFGQFSIQLPATNDPQFSEVFTYTVQEAFIGGRTWQTTLPEATPVVDITDLVPASAAEPYTELASYQAYVYENLRVTAQEAVLSLSPAGVDMPVNYGGARVAYTTYGEVASTEATYATLTAGAGLIAGSNDANRLDDLRVNLAVNPSLGSATTGWSTIQSGALRGDFAYSGVSSYRVIMTSTSDSTVATATFDALEAGAHQFSCYVYVPSGSALAGRTVTLSLEGGTASTSGVVATAGTLVAGSWVRTSVAFTVGSPGSIVFVCRLSGSLSTAWGRSLYVDAALLEKAAALGAYFDGDYDGFWDGVAHASISRIATVPSYAERAEYWAAIAVAQAENVFPSPFLFTGSLGVQR